MCISLVLNMFYVCVCIHHIWYMYIDYLNISMYTINQLYIYIYNNIYIINEPYIYMITIR